MNKTVTINLSGIVFHIDENAYDQLRKYLDTLRRHFANTSGKDEIIADIETRFAEMFNDRITPGKNVITLSDVQEVIAIMGKPEEVAAGDEEMGGRTASGDSVVSTESARKRFFRNPEDKVLGGVCSGIAAYFDFDPIWLRVLFVLTVIFAGTGVLLYIILWVIIPEARTASEKLQMRGEAVTVANIQKSVQDEMQSVKKWGEQYAGEVLSDQNKARARSGAQRVGDFIGDFFRAIFKFIAGLFGLLITIFSIGMLLALTIAIFSGIGVFTFALPKTIVDMVLTESQLWWLIIGGLLTIGIPFSLLLLNGLKILFKVKLNLKAIGTVLAGLWLVGIGISILTAFSIAREYEHDATVKRSEQISVTGNTVVLKAIDHWSTEGDEHFSFGDIEDLIVLGKNNDSVIAPFVRLDVEQSDDDSIHLEQRFTSCGRSYDEARERAADINYGWSQTDSVISIPNYFAISSDSKFRGQQVKLVLQLPVGKSVKFDESLDWMLNDIGNVRDTWDRDMLGRTWLMKQEGLDCTNCPVNFEQSRVHEWSDGKKRIRIEPDKVIIDNNGKHIEITHNQLKIDSQSVSMDTLQ